MQYNYVFAVRPSTVCNFKCEYCYRVDDTSAHYKQCEFDIDSMIWHSGQLQSNIFNFCGYGETMLHPQFADMVIALSSVTNINWVTNGTLLNGSDFDRILSDANHKNIRDVIISIHFGQIRDFSEFYPMIKGAVYDLGQCGIITHLTTILTDSNVDEVLYFRRYFPNLVIKQAFPTYVQNGKMIYTSYSEDTKKKLDAAGVSPGLDFFGMQPPYIGKVCPNGSRVIEVMHDGKIYDCSYDTNRIQIGNINIKEQIMKLPYPRICKENCNKCIPVLRDGYSLLLDS